MEARRNIGAACWKYIWKLDSHISSNKMSARLADICPKIILFQSQIWDFKGFSFPVNPWVFHTLCAKKFENHWPGNSQDAAEELKLVETNSSIMKKWINSLYTLFTAVGLR